MTTRRTSERSPVAPSKSPIDNQTGRTPLRRDDQQWVLDYMIQETGKTYHFQGEGRGELPKSVRSHAMISKHLGKDALRLERLAGREEAAGHPETALDFYYHAAVAFGRAQHPIFDLNEQKRFLYAGLRRCYDKVCELAPYSLEHIDIPWGDTVVSGNLHLNPQVSGPAPVIFYVPGCDTFKEAYPNPHFNFAHQRGMHIFSFEGPGGAESNLRGIRLTATNFEEAASAALDHLVQRPEIDPEQVAVYANSFGSFWGMRFAAHDPRVKAVAAMQASIAEKFIQTDLESPRWKQLFAFITQAESEAELDAVMRDMTMDGYMERIQAPSLMTVGEYDPRAPLEEVYQLFDQLTAPGELWVMVDQHHDLKIGNQGGALWTRTTQGVAVDWLRDRLRGLPLDHPGQVRRVQGADGPNSPSVEHKRQWYDDLA